MNKDTFLRELRHKLRRLPQSEIDTALQYYNEYFSDAGEEREAAVIANLGSIDSIAAKIIGEYAVNDADVSRKGRKGFRAIWISLLAVCAAPIAIPIAGAILCVTVALLFALAVTAGAVVVACVSVVAHSIFCIIAGIILLFSEFPSGLFFIGTGLTTAGLGTLLTFGAIKLFKSILSLMQKGIGKFLIRRSSK